METIMNLENTATNNNSLLFNTNNNTTNSNSINLDNKAQIIADFANRNAKDPALENKIMFIQRHIRAKQRKESEISRIGAMYFKDVPNDEIEKKVEEVIKDSNTPYRPQKCAPALADRIVSNAGKITLYSTVSHVTAQKYISQVVDGCLYGRKNLDAMGISYSPAALCDCDINEGDGNVICFGPHLIDPMCKESTQAVRLDFDLEKILDSKNFNANPCLFFKQRDLGYNPHIKHKVDIKNESLKYETSSHGGQTALFEKSCKSAAWIPNYSLISYNLMDMQKILVLNFFRFLDGLCYLPNCEVENRKTIDHIYGLIEQLNDEELVEFLTAIGKKMSCTSEFNFYGAYKIDLNALLRITIYKSPARTTELRPEDETIVMNQLFDELNKGAFDSFNKIKKDSPELFQSARFVEFLISKISDPQIAAKVKTLIQQ